MPGYPKPPQCLNTNLAPPYNATEIFEKVEGVVKETQSADTGIVDAKIFVKGAENAANDALVLVDAANNAVQYAARTILTEKYGNVESIIEKAKDIAKKLKMPPIQP